MIFTTYKHVKCYYIILCYTTDNLIHFIGFKYLQPPPLPSNHVHRHSLLDEIAIKLLQVTNDPCKYETTLIITGAGGFGKTSIVTSLCHHPPVKEQFTDGFVFIELGPQATDPNVKLVQLYHLLTGENLKQCDIKHAEQEIKKLANDYYRNVLVIIDDVWHVEDAEPLVKAFSNCKTILTTRMNDVEKYIPSIQSVTIGPMTKMEALSLITKGVINSSQLSPEDQNFLYELAQDVHLWPLLLSLVRGQLLHYIKHYHLPYHKAIQNVQGKLYNKGLTAFDKSNIESINKSRKLAVEACIEMTLELLTKSVSDKVKIFVLCNGIGMSLQTTVLHNLWNISKQEAEDVVDTLWAYGLAHVIDNAASPNFNPNPCLEIHAVISQYIIECVDYKNVQTLDPVGGKLNTWQAVSEGLILMFQESYGVHNLSSFHAKEFLKYKLSQLENIILPSCIRVVNTQTITDPHYMTLFLQHIQKLLTALPFTLNLIGLSFEELNSLIAECKRTSRSTYMLCRKLNQSVQRILYERNYDKLIPAIQEFMRIYPLFNVAQKAVTIVKKIIPYCEGELLDFINELSERLHLLTPDYHQISTVSIPLGKVYVEQLKLITSALMNGSPDIELTYNYFTSDEGSEDITLILANCLIKRQEVAPNIVNKDASKYYTGKYHKIL